MPPNNAAGNPGGTPPELVRLNTCWNMWNVDGSSDAVSLSGFHARDYEVATGLRPLLCAFEGCNNRPQVGGHVWLPGKYSGVYIVPICRPCNDPDNKARWMGGGSRVRAGATLMKVQKTRGMCNAVRRVEAPRTRRSKPQRQQLLEDDPDGQENLLRGRAPQALMPAPQAPAPAPARVNRARAQARPYNRRSYSRPWHGRTRQAAAAAAAAPSSLSVTVTVGA